MSKFNKAVLISSAQVEPNRPPPGLGFLAGVCDVCNIEYTPYDLNVYILKELGEVDWTRLYHYTSQFQQLNTKLEQLIDSVLNSFVDKIKCHDADIIILTVLTYWQNYWCQRLLEKIKEKSISAKILIGGSGVSVEHSDKKSFAKFLCDQDLVDYYILGEGDLALVDLLNGKQVAGVNNKHSKLETWAPQIDDLDSIPLPSYKKLPVKNYQSYSGSGGIAITGSRGCVRRCTFCDVGNIWKKFRFRSANHIVDEIKKHYYETGELNFFFTDSLINGSLKTFVNFMEKVVQLQQIDSVFEKISYTSQFIVRSPKQHTEYIFELMKKTGYSNVQIGVETASDKVRYHMQKKFTTADLDYHMEMSNKYGLRNTLMMMVGYPTETLDDYQETLDLVRRYQKYLLNGTIIDLNEAYPLTILKNTPLYNMAHELGIEVNDNYGNLHWVSKENPDLTVKERWRRFINFHRELILLGYPRPAESQILYEQYLTTVKSLKEIEV